MRVRDLLAPGAPRLRLLVVEEELDRQVSGVMTTDLQDPGRYLHGGELVLTTAHELGHAFGLTHVDPGVRRSVMNPNNITVSPTSEDVAKLHALWRPCGASEASAGSLGDDGSSHNQDQDL